MNTDDYDDDEPLPVDSLVTDFVIANFDRRVSRGPHLRDCPERVATDVAAHSRTTCGEGTCEIDPQVSVLITCPHQSRGITWSVEAETVGKLLEQIAAFSDARVARLAAFAEYAAGL